MPTRRRYPMGSIAAASTPGSGGRRRISGRRATPQLAALATLAIAWLPAAPANATYLSGVGDDNNAATGCQRSAPCKTLQGALSATVANGTINCLDSTLSVGPVNITTSVTIDCSEGIGEVIP